jgi:hypothetical protein
VKPSRWLCILQVAKGKKEHQTLHAFSGTTVRLKTFVHEALCAVLTHLPPCFLDCTTAFLELNRDRYIDATNPLGKKVITRETVDFVLSNDNSRFLKRTKNQTGNGLCSPRPRRIVNRPTRFNIACVERRYKRQFALGPITTPGGGTTSLSQFSRTSRPCLSRACQQTALLCSTLCQYCHSLAVYRQWY